MVEDPVFCEIDRDDDRKGIEQHLLDFMMEGKNSVFQHPKLAVIILGDERKYPIVKEIFDHYRVPSQVVTVRNALGFNLSKASNVTK